MPIGTRSSAKGRHVLLIHGAWMTPRYWENFKCYFADRGYAVLTPGWPGRDRLVEDIRLDSLGRPEIGMREIVDHYAAILDNLREPPILIGHCFGGLVVQTLLDMGLGRAGVAIGSPPPKGVVAAAPWRLRSHPPLLLGPAPWTREVALSYRSFQRAFAHLLTESQARANGHEFETSGASWWSTMVRVTSRVPGSVELRV